MAQTPTGPVPTGLIPLDDASAERLKRIAEAAYKRAQQRNFAPGHDLEDWLARQRNASMRGPIQPQNDDVALRLIA